jgi:hypothetical protein
MATIAGVSVGSFSLPENPRKSRFVSLGIPADSSSTPKYLRLGNSRNYFTISLKAKSTSVKDALIAALEADSNNVVSIDPDAGVDLGGGDGVAVNAFLMDSEYLPSKTNYEVWNIVLEFLKV